MLTSPQTVTVGRSCPRPDARDKVCGRESYVCDMSLPHMLHAAIVRSSRPHARLLNVDTRAALSLPGVAAALVASDIPGENCIPVVLRDQPLLADGIVRYIGEPIALVAAHTEELARAAAAAVHVTYEDLPAVFDLAAARNHPDAHVFGDDNVFKHLHVVRGDASAELTRCDVVVTHEYRTPPQEHAYLETQGMLAVPEPGGTMHVFGSMQCPFYVREAVACVLGIPLADAQITQTGTGGAFGGKEDVPSLPAAQAAVLALATRRPVKLVYRRDEDIATTSKRHAALVRASHGASRDGILRAARIEYLIDGGAYATLSPVVLFRGVAHAVGPYRCPHVDVQGYALATNHVPAGAFRGFGSPQVLFAAERQMDCLAQALQLDPCDVRRRNLLTAGDRTITNQRLPNSVGALETLTQARASLERLPAMHDALEPGEDYGRGVSTIYYGVGLGAGGEHMARAGATLQINADGSVACAVGTTEIGQGMRTVLAQIAAEALGINVARVHMLPSDTTRVPDSGPTVASRATTMSGGAIVNAAEQLRERLLCAAAGKCGLASHMLSLHNEQVCEAATGTPVGMTFLDCLDACAALRVDLSAQGWHHPPHLEFDWNTGQGDAYAVYAFATNIAEVAVNPDSGAVRVLRIIAAHDVGKAVNPAAVEGQIEGGTLQGLGYALMEEIVNDQGRIANPHFSTYIIPTCVDVPEIVPVIVEDPYPDGPFGAKGFGEQPLMGIAPAVANAVCNAIPVALHELPITPERVWAALQQI